ncbi:MAG: NIPSNAP family containing protein [Chloroflexi bacterium]|nr:NIPSNAP family containing protein [Chloroflexota bacterium]MBE43535.1 NIPSNAP family containing protein [Chloroflexota bacterium]
MVMFFELREYRTLPGQRENWVRFMEEEIIPFQVSKGMVILGSFVGEEEDDLYVWIRRFESEEEREKLYAAVYESDNWVNEIGPKIPEMMDRSKIVVRRLEASSRSVIQ